jgi:hypothetical protein
MATGYWLSQAIYVAAKLDLADLLKDGRKSCSALAVATGADRQSPFRLMRALSSAGCLLTQDDYFALSRAGESLQSHVSGSLRAIVMTLGKIHYRAWGDLLQSVRTGSPAFNSVFGTGLFDYLHEMPKPRMRSTTDDGPFVIVGICHSDGLRLLGNIFHCRHRRWAGEIAPKSVPMRAADDARRLSEISSSRFQRELMRISSVVSFTIGM